VDEQVLPLLDQGVGIDAVHELEEGLESEFTATC
jgi:hypothetical protein